MNLLMNAEKKQTNLIRGIQRGDLDCFRLFYREHLPPLQLYLGSILHHREDAEECIQELFKTLWQKPAILEQAAEIKKYLFGMARNLALKKLRSRERQNQLEAKAGEVLKLEALEPSRRNEKLEIAQRLGQWISELQSEEKEVLLLHVFEDFSFGQLEEILGTPKNTLHDRYKKALLKLKGKAREKGWDEKDLLGNNRGS